MTRLAWFVALVAVFGWAMFLLFDRFQMFADVPMVRVILFNLGLAITGFAAIGILGQFIVDVLFRLVFEVETTGIIVAAIYVILGFVIGAVVLRIMGFDVVAILTTSAIIGVLVGFSMQTTIGSMISGIALSSENLFARGAGVEVDGEVMMIERKLWRHVIARRGDNVKVLVPNEQLARSTLSIYPPNTPIGFSVALRAPLRLPPGQLSSLLGEAFADMPQIDAASGIELVPGELEPGGDGDISYELHLFARDFRQLDEVKGEVGRRAWYAMNRAGLIDAPVEPRVLRQMVKTASPGMEPGTVEHILREGTELRFAPSEILSFSAERERHQCLIVAGQAEVEDDLNLTPLPPLPNSGNGAQKQTPDALPRIAKLRRIADRLAEDIGPVAEVAVQDALRQCRGFDALVRQLSDFIENPNLRSRFLEDLSDFAAKLGERGPGTITALSTDAIGRVLTDPVMRAKQEVTVIVYPRPVSR